MNDLLRHAPICFTSYSPGGILSSKIYSMNYLAINQFYRNLNGKNEKKWTKFIKIDHCVLTGSGYWNIGEQCWYEL